MTTQSDFLRRIADKLRQIRDAASIHATLADRLDQAYLQRWARELGVLDLLKQISSTT